MRWVCFGASDRGWLVVVIRYRCPATGGVSQCLWRMRKYLASMRGRLRRCTPPWRCRDATSNPSQVRALPLLPSSRLPCLRRGVHSHIKTIHCQTAAPAVRCCFSGWTICTENVLSTASCSLISGTEGKCQWFLNTYRYTFTAT